LSSFPFAPVPFAARASHECFSDSELPRRLLAFEEARGFGAAKLAGFAACSAEITLAISAKPCVRAGSAEHCVAAIRSLSHGLTVYLRSAFASPRRSTDGESEQADAYLRSLQLEPVADLATERAHHSVPLFPLLAVIGQPISFAERPLTAAKLPLSNAPGSDRLGSATVLGAPAHQER
jgi:hypothetical protein